MDVSPSNPRFVTVCDLREGLPVEYLGDDDLDGIDDPSLCSRHMRLFHGHPGRVWFTDAPHVMVQWVGLEDEVVSFAVGFGRVDPRRDEFDEHSPYPGLGLLTESEFERRQLALGTVLATGDDLTGWMPPWRTH